MENKYSFKVRQLAQATALTGLLTFGVVSDMFAQHQSKYEALFKRPNRESAQPLGAAALSTNSAGDPGTPAIFSHERIGFAQNHAYYMPNGNSWELSSYKVFSYNANGSVASETYKNSLNENERRYLSLYDSHGNETENIFQVWEENAWNTASRSKTFYTYSTDGKMTQNIGQYTNSDGVLANDTKIDYTYDASGRLISEEYSEWREGSWSNRARTALSYTGTNTLISTFISQRFEHNVWVNRYRIYDIVWHNADVISSYTAQVWNTDANVWVSDYRVSVTLAANGSTVETDQNYKDGVWTNYGRYSVTNDAKRNNVDSKFERWTDDGVWSLRYHDQYLLTYNSTDDITERVSRGLDMESKVWTNYSKTVYSNFFRVTTSLNTTLAKMDVSVYPNPAATAIVIEAAITENTQFQLIDLTGKILINKTITPSGSTVQRLDVATLPAGIYVVSLKNSKASYNSKIVKQ